MLPYVGDEEFCFTYGDGLADVDITALIAFHREQGARATVTAVQPPGRFGALELEGERVREFEEKPRGDGGWTNGGFFVLSPGDRPLPRGRRRRSGSRSRCARSRARGSSRRYRHEGFWQAMDTLRDRNQLEELWGSGDGAVADVGDERRRRRSTPASGAGAACC